MAHFLFLTGKPLARQWLKRGMCDRKNDENGALPMVMPIAQQGPSNFKVMISSLLVLNGVKIRLLAYQYPHQVSPATLISFVIFSVPQISHPGTNYGNATDAMTARVCTDV